MWIKKMAIGTGITIGILAAFVVMVSQSSRSEAAIAVIDKQNIAEAVKTAINTAAILTNSEKELALQLLNMTKIDVDKLVDIIYRKEQKKDQVFNEKQDMMGVLASNSSVVKVWDEQLGNLDDVINGNVTIYDFVKRERQRQKVLDETSKTAAKAAANALVHGQETLTDVNEALNLSNSAEGQLQAAQAGNIIMANTAYAVDDGNRLLSNMTAMMAVQYQQENLRRAESQRVLQDSCNLSKEWLRNATVKE